MRQRARVVTGRTADSVHVGANPSADLMAEETTTVTRTVEEEVTIYKCDKCHGRFHDRVEDEDELHRVIFGAEVYSNVTVGDAAAANNTFANGHPEPTVSGEYEYLLCERCLESAHEYLRDFF